MTCTEKIRPFGRLVICHVQTRFSSSLWSNWHLSFFFAMCQHLFSRRASPRGLRGSGLTVIHSWAELFNTQAETLTVHEWPREQASLVPVLNSPIHNCFHVLHDTANWNSSGFWLGSEAQQAGCSVATVKQCCLHGAKFLSIKLRNLAPVGYLCPGSSITVGGLMHSLRRKTGITTQW